MAARECQCERLFVPFRGPDRRTPTPTGGVASRPVPHNPEFHYSDLLPTGADDTPYRLVTTEGVSTDQVNGRTFLQVSPDAIRQLTAEAMHDIAHYLRPAHLAQLRRIIDDPESSGNDRFVALDLLKNVNISAGGVLPMCQDTGTAIVMGKKSEGVLTGADDGEAISRGVYDAYTKLNLRYSQLAPLTMWDEKNTGTNLPAQIELYSTPGTSGRPEYKFLFMAKGGGSANKSFLFQETKAVLNPARMLKFLDEKIRSLGTAACPPYHLAVVIGGTSAEFALKTAKYASAHYLDNLPTEGSMAAHGFRDLQLEEEVFKLTQSFGIGAQFGGKYFCHDVRVVRLPRHGASCPVAIAVSCSADRQALGKITADGVFLEQLETDPAHYLPDTETQHLAESGDVVKIDLNRPMAEILAELTKHPVKTRLSLTGPLVVARDIAHAKIQERLDAGEEMPEYLRDHPVYYAGPAKTPEGFASGSFGPTTAGRMDSYVESFQAAGGSMVMLAKGNRSKQVTEACRAHGGFYLGSIGGPAARLAQDCIKSVSVLEYEELGMEAVWKIEVEDFPAFIVVDDKGNDFFTDPSGAVTVPISGIRVRSAE
jgi:fumarate hydratase class I